jgi:hypothetical protein
MKGCNYPDHQTSPPSEKKQASKQAKRIKNWLTFSPFYRPDFLDSPLVRSWVGRGPDGRRMCKLCGITGGDVTRIKNHIESVHWPNSKGYACEQCTAVCKTRHALASHKSRHHSQKKRPRKESNKKSAKTVVAPVAHIELNSPLDVKQEILDDPTV